MSYLDHYTPDDNAQGDFTDLKGCGLVSLLSALLIGGTALAIFLAS